MDPTLILIVLFLGAFIVFQIFQGRKRRRETETRQTLFVPGIEIMTNYGLYGTILSIDDDKNLAVIETTPGTQLKIHRQTILKVADYDTPVADDAVADDAVADDAVADDAVADDAARVATTADDDQLPIDSGTRPGRAATTGAPTTGADEPRFTEPRFGELRDDPRKSSRPTDAAADATAKDKSGDQ